MTDDAIKQCKWEQRYLHKANRDSEQGDVLPLQLVRRGLLVLGVGVVEGVVGVEHVADGLVGREEATLLAGQVQTNQSLNFENSRLIMK